MKLYYIFALGVSVLCMPLTTLFGDGQNQSVSLAFGLGAGAAHSEQEETGDSAGMVTSKIIVTTPMAITTGVLMALALPLSKNHENLSTPLAVAAITGLLLYSQSRLLKKLFGADYTDYATWISTAAMVCVGLAMTRGGKKEAAEALNGIDF